MTQFTLAHKSGINPSRISLIENGHIEPTQDDRDRLARALKADVSAVFPPLEQAVAS